MNVTEVNDAIGRHNNIIEQLSEVLKRINLPVTIGVTLNTIGEIDAPILTAKKLIDEAIAIIKADIEQHGFVIKELRKCEVDIKIEGLTHTTLK